MVEDISFLGRRTHIIKKGSTAWKGSRMAAACCSQVVYFLRILLLWKYIYSNVVKKIHKVKDPNIRRKEINTYIQVKAGFFQRGVGRMGDSRAFRNWQR